MTKYGRMIADPVLTSRQHPTAEEIYLQLRAAGTRISMATVYNNLRNLEELVGILEQNLS